MIPLIDFQRRIRASLSFLFNEQEKQNLKIKEIIEKTHKLLSKNQKTRGIEKKKNSQNI